MTARGRNRLKRTGAGPLVSVVMVVYNGEEYPLPTPG